MALSKDEMDQVIDAHFAYEAADDVDGVCSTLSADVDHDIIGTPTGPVTGPDQARLFYERLFADMADGKVTHRKRLYGEGFVVDDSEWSGTAVGTPFGLEGRGRPLTFRILHIFEFAADGKIARENAWVDFQAIHQQLPQD